MLFCALCVGLTTALAQNPRQNKVIATPNPIEVQQPNGETLTIRLRGDERSHYRITEDGYRIELNKAGTYCYCKKNKQGQYVISKKQAHNAADRTKCEKRFLQRVQPQE